MTEQPPLPTDITTDAQRGLQADSVKRRAKRRAKARLKADARPAGKTHIIVTGVARSGTTALARLLNAHEEICLGVERFKFQFLRQNNYSADLFERDRFFTFLEDDTNILPDGKPEWQPLYAEIARKWDSARVIGDKVPDMMPVLAEFLCANPDFKCIYILRSLKGVALSWQTRADDRRDNWPSGRGFELACESWAAQAHALEQLMASGQVKGRILLLDYDKMYKPGDRSAEAILRFLGLGPSAAFSATYQEHIDFFQNRAAVRGRLSERFKTIYADTDKADFRALRRRAQRHMVKLAGKRSRVLTP